MTGVDESVELRTCPFCGGPPKVTGVRDGRKVYCVSCRASAGAEYHGPDGWDGTEKRAIQAWNTRSTGTGEVLETVARHLIALEDNMLRNDADMLLDRDGSPSPRELASMLLGRPLTDEEEGFPPALSSKGAGR